MRGVEEKYQDYRVRRAVPFPPSTRWSHEIETLNYLMTTWITKILSARRTQLPEEM